MRAGGLPWAALPWASVYTSVTEIFGLAPDRSVQSSQRLISECGNVRACRASWLQHPICRGVSTEARWRCQRVNGERLLKLISSSYPYLSERSTARFFVYLIYGPCSPGCAMGRNAPLAFNAHMRARGYGCVSWSVCAATSWLYCFLRMATVIPVPCELASNISHIQSRSLPSCVRYPKIDRLQTETLTTPG